LSAMGPPVDRLRKAGAAVAAGFSAPVLARLLHYRRPEGSDHDVAADHG
jgi:hypothetical protein